MSDTAVRPAWDALLVILGLNALLRAPEILLGTLPWTLAYFWEGPLRLFSLDLFAIASLLALHPSG